MPVDMSDDPAQAEKPMDIPKELWMMVDHLNRNASQQVGTGNTKWDVCIRLSFEEDTGDSDHCELGVCGQRPWDISDADAPGCTVWFWWLCLCVQASAMSSCTALTAVPQPS